MTDKSVYLDKGNGNYLNLFNAGKIAHALDRPLGHRPRSTRTSTYGVEILPADVSHATHRGPRQLGHARQRRSRSPRTRARSCSGSPRREVHLQYAIATSTLPLRKSETKLPEYQSVYLAKYPTMEVFVANIDNATKARPNIAATRRSRSRWARPCRRCCWARPSRSRRSTPPSQQVDAILACRASDAGAAASRRARRASEPAGERRDEARPAGRRAAAPRSGPPPRLRPSRRLALRLAGRAS